MGNEIMSEKLDLESEYSRRAVYTLRIFERPDYGEYPTLAAPPGSEARVQIMINAQQPRDVETAGYAGPQRPTLAPETPPNSGENPHLKRISPLQWPRAMLQQTREKWLSRGIIIISLGETCAPAACSASPSANPRKPPPPTFPPAG